MHTHRYMHAYTHVRTTRHTHHFLIVVTEQIKVIVIIIIVTGSGCSARSCGCSTASILRHGSLHSREPATGNKALVQCKMTVLLW